MLEKPIMHSDCRVNGNFNLEPEVQIKGRPCCEC